MAKAYGTLPNGARTAASDIVPFELRVPEGDLERFKMLLALSPIGPKTWDNGDGHEGRFGLSRAWLVKAKVAWLGTFNWRLQEARINGFPNFYATVGDDKCGNVKMHFAALFSEREEAVPVVFMHGWPGSFLEFLPMMALLKHKYKPSELPYHIIVPSLPGYALSGTPTLEHEFTTADAARIIDGLMRALGFEKGYIAQGGDVGAILCADLAKNHQACKAQHVNMWMYELDAETSKNLSSKVTEAERQSLERQKTWRLTGAAYALTHGTRPATIGLVLSSSPLALLAWIGEKFIEWSDTTPPLEEILAGVSLYWLTASFPHSIYPYRALAARLQGEGQGFGPLPDRVPCGYSSFPKEISTLPKAWAETFPSLTFYGPHQDGGHFAALEKPEVLLRDVEDFVEKFGKLVRAPAIAQVHRYAD